MRRPFAGLGRRQGMAAALVFLGLLPIGMHFAATRILDRWVRQDEMRRLAMQQVQTALAESHLWIEEYVTGDHDVLEGIGTNLARAATLLDSLADEGPTAPEGGTIALRDPKLQARLGAIRSEFEAFRDLSRARVLRYDRGESVGVGSPFDSEFDARFRSLFDGVADAARELERRQAENRSRIRLFFAATLTAWLGLVGFTGLAILWTERKRAAAERELQEKNLQLFQAQKMEAVGRLAGGVAHDINNYLGAIRTQTELARLHDPGDESLTRRTDSILRSVKTASGLIERLLAFARPRPMRPRVIHLDRLIEEDLQEMLRRLLGDRFRLSLRRDPELWRVKMDRVHAEQIVVNLVMNAREAMSKGGTVTVETGNRRIDSDTPAGPSELPQGDYVVLSVGDTGSGIDPGIRDRIFEPFFTTKESSGNSGLGLSTVYGIVSEYGGAIRVDSRPENGTVFEILLPRSTDPPSRAELIDESEGAVPRGTESILLVEDNDELRTSTHELLEFAGYRVTSVGEPGKALALVEQSGRHFDGLVTDVAMPGMSGRELAERLRRYDDRLKFLFISGHADDEIVRLGVLPDRSAVLRKPYSLSELTAELRRVLDV